MYHQNIPNFQQMNDSSQNLSVQDFSFQNFDPSLSLDLPAHFGSHVPLTESDMHLVGSETNFNNVSISSIPVEVDNLLFPNQVQMHSVLQPSYQLQVSKEPQYLQQPMQVLHNDIQLFQQFTTSSSEKKNPEGRKAKKKSTEKKIICGVCGKLYVSMSGLTRHTQKVHNAVTTADNGSSTIDPNAFLQKKSSLTDERSIQFKTAPPDFTFGGSSRNHKCSECGHAFSSPHVLKMHQATHSNTETIPCDVCQETINMMDLPSHFMAKHVIINSQKDAQDRKFICAICSKKYKMKKDIQKHVAIHSSIRPWKCDFCTEAFQSFAYLSEHLRTHAVRTLKCRYCDKVFKTHSVRCKHEKTIHLGDRTHLIKKYECDKCNKSFTSNAKLMNHGYTHLGIKPHKCYICSNKRYSHERDLHIHMRKYHPEFKVIKRKGKEPLLIGPEDKPWALVTRARGGARLGDKSDSVRRKGKNKPFKCGKCRLSFVTKRGLELHSRFHDDSPSAMCQICRSNIEIILHMNHFLSDHSTYEETTNNGKITSRIFTCNVCNYKCYKKKNMQKHFVNHSDVRPWECDHCKAKFSLLEYLLDHERIHEAGKLSCRTCNKLFKTHTLRSRHERVVHQGRRPNKKFYCPVCGKQFESQCKVNIHMAGHTGEKNFKCKICKKEKSTDCDSA